MSGERAHVVVKGRVQGVCYRAFVRDAALGLGLKGWVRNLGDGSVEATIEGDRAAIDEMLKQCRTGPPGARVLDIGVQWEQWKGEFNSFMIRYS